MSTQLNSVLSAIVARKKEKLPPQREACISLDELPVTGNIEDDDKAEGEAVRYSLANASKALAEFTDMGFYVPLVFLSRDQLNEFLTQAGWSDCLVHNEHGEYLDGIQLAKHLAVVLPSAVVKYRDPKPDKRLVEEVGIFTEE